MNSLTQLLHWIKARPFHAIALASLTSVVATCWATEAFDRGFLMTAALVTVLLTALVIWRTPVLVALLASALVCSTHAAPDADPQPAGAVVAGVVVVVIGGVAVVYVVKFCQKHFPKTTNAPISISLDGPEPDAYAGAWSYMSLGSCDLPGTDLTATAAFQPGAPESLRRVELTGVMESSPEGSRFRLHTLQSAPSLPGDTTDFASWNEGLRAHGIRWPDYVGQPVFGRGGQPAGADAVPIHFDALNRTVTIGSGAVHSATLERSVDLHHWEPVVTLLLPAGQSVRFSDLSASPSLFYRVR